MINHARSLLLNADPATRPELGTYGEEYVPAAYRVLDYAGYLGRIRNKLLGSANDPLYQNYRLAQLMDVVHANQYVEELALSLDARYTYRPFKPSFMNFDFSVEVEPVTPLNMELITTGEPVADETIGQALYRWQVKTVAGPQLEVTEYGSGVTTRYSLTLSGTAANSVVLENGLQLLLTVPYGSWQVGAAWIVTSMSRPAVDLGYSVQALNDLGAGAVYQLFADAPSSFKNLWYSGVSLVDQLGGVLGAFIYKTEELRQDV